MRLHEEYLEKFSNDQRTEVCSICHKDFSKGGFTTNDRRLFCGEKCLEKATEKARRGEIEGWKEVLGLWWGEENDEKKRSNYFQEYQSKFKKIVLSVTNLTSEILINLENFGYIIQGAKWTSELQAPSLTREGDWSFIKPGVSFQLGKK